MSKFIAPGSKPAVKPVILFLFCLLAFTFPASGSSLFSGEPVKKFQGADAAPWDCVELHNEPHPEFGSEKFSNGSKQKNGLIKKWFGTATPNSSKFLLHFYQGWNQKTLKNPVLLVHGAADDANRAWIFPFGQKPEEQSLPAREKWGFATWLAEMGYSVFAITFAHNQGCNIRQSEQIANAIKRIRQVTGNENEKDFSVDVIAHSKGNAAVRLYCSDSREIFPQRRWLSSFRGDIRTYINIAGPLQGIDTPFRYYGFNFARAVESDETASTPMAAEKMVIYGMWKSFSGESYSGAGNELWPGQAQVLFNLVRDGGIPLGVDSYTAVDANFSMSALYHGGTSLFLSSKGIDAAIEKGERLMYRLEEKGIDPSVRLAILCGKNPIIQKSNASSLENLGFLYLGLFMKTWSEPCDGLIFCKTMENTRGILMRGAKLIGRRFVDLNHLDVARRPEMIRIIDDWLMN